VRVFCATFYSETNTFSPLLTGYDEFRPLALAARGSPSFVAAFAPVHELGGVVVGGFNRAALPGGTVIRAAYEALRKELLDDLAAHLPVDFVALNLHGAMVADGYLDCEGDVLARIRAIVGPSVPIVAALDPHAHLSAAMLSFADVLVAYREYPHTDEAATFAEAVRLGIAAAARRIRPYMSALSCGQIAEYHTSRGPMRDIVAEMRSWEARDDVLAVSLIHGFPWGDVPDMGSQALVVTDGNPEFAKELAARLVSRIRSVRGRTTNEVLPFEDALDLGTASPGPIVVADVCDNPGGGAPGDSTFLLQSLLGRSCAAALGPLWDPLAVQRARGAGPGAQLRLRVGGKTDICSGLPVDIDATVIASSEALSTAGVGGYDVNYGPSVSVRTGPLELVLTTEREQAMSPSLFGKLGIDLGTKQVVVVKSAQHFRAAFEPLARRVLYASSPGALNLDFASLPYRRANRQLWPLTR
jgi:microcystin degradation protein MlrC